MAEQGPAGAAGRREVPERLTIGLVTANIHLGVGATLWSGAVRAAERDDVNLVCFPGGSLRPGGDASRSALYELVDRARLDGVVCWSSTLGLPASGDHAERLLRSLRRLPVVSLNHALEGVDDHETLTLDSYAGMRELVGHLVARHGVRRPACIRGPLTNPVSFGRYRAYTQALAQYRLPAERQLVCAAGDFAAGAGASAMRVLLDARGLRPGVDFDAVVACSDVLAADALRLLAERGIRVPEDVAVVGFNDSPEARLSEPPLTSVSLPFAELGGLAVDTLVARLRGGRAPDRRAVAGAVVVRRSCGCPSPLVAEGLVSGGSLSGGSLGDGPGSGGSLADGPQPSGSRSEGLRSGRSASDGLGSGGSLTEGSGSGGSLTDGPQPGGSRSERPRSSGSRSGGSLLYDEVFAALPCAGRELAAAFRADADPAWADAGRVADVDRAGARGPGVQGAGLRGADVHGPGSGPHGFLPMLERLLGRQVRRPETVAAWERALLEIRDDAVRCLPEAARVRGERLLAQARLLAADASRRLLEYERWLDAQEAGRLREFGTALTTVVDLDGLGEVLERHAVAGGLPGCRVVLYEGAWNRLSGPGRGLARVLPVPSASGDHGGARPDPDPYPAHLLLPDELLPEADRFTFVLEPLHVGDEQLGFAVFESGTGHEADRRGSLYRALGDQISAALKGIRLFAEVRRARDAAERASTFKTRLLAQVTQELRGPLEEIRRHAGTEAGGDEAGGGEAGGGEALQLVRRDADRLLRLVDDLLEWSRTGTDELGPSPRLIDPRPVLVKAFRAVAATAPGGADWSLVLPRRLPAVLADREQLTKAVCHVLDAAARSDTQGGVVLTARTAPTSVRITVTAVADPSADPRSGEAEGAGLGSATARRLVMLHGGSYAVGDSPPHIRLTVELPLPAAPGPRAPSAGAGRTLLAVGTGRPSAGDVTALARQHRLRLRPVDPDPDLDSDADAAPPTGERTVAAVVWDVEAAGPEEWRVAQRLYDEPALSGTPFVLFGVTGEDLAQALRGQRPSKSPRPVIVADGVTPSRERLRRSVATALRGHPVRTAADGTTALTLIAEEEPHLVIAQRTLADMDGFDFVDRIRVLERRLWEGGPGETGVAGGSLPGGGVAGGVLAGGHLTGGRPPCPVLLLSAEGFTHADAHRAKSHPGLVLLDRDILTEDETARLVVAMTGDGAQAAGRNRALVHQALVCLQTHYRRRISRWQIAQAVGVSADHLGRLFHQQYGLTVWEYLTRLRIQRACEQLRGSEDSIQSVARAVGFTDRAYFSRVFRRVTGVAPHAYRTAGPAVGPQPRDAGTGTGTGLIEKAGS
ncbi:substrate-binding domain-containing protein [Streptomyces sp. NPDC048825]|uniref:substrate-binding domain-containing protein n=1 Tax=Streptomyces sp. NPDC048825 TaxID=3365592 RepID=UPI00371508D4